MLSKKPDTTLLAIAAILILFGLFMITSAGAVLSQEKFGQSFYFVKNQILKGLLPGLILGYIAYLIPYTFWRKFAGTIFLASIILLILVFIPGLGVTLGGARRWIHVSFLFFQPSEIFKIGLIIYLAAFFEKTAERRKKNSGQGLLIFLAILCVGGLLIGLQPDLGTLGIVILTSFAMYFVAKTPITHLAILGGLGASAFLLFIKIYPHALQRIQVLINPKIDSQGIGYQMNQGLIALGSGGIFGQGLAQGKQKFLYLPQPASDSIVAVIGEELGFLGVLGVSCLFAFFISRGINIAKKAPDQFSKLLAAGLTSLIAIQAFINIAAIAGLIPLPGVTLPFISYGGTSLVISMVAVGMIMNISKYASR